MLTQISGAIWVNLDIANHLLHVEWICPGNGLVPIRQQAFNRTHDDKDKMFKKWLHVYKQ